MHILLNCHLAAFCTDHLEFKKWLNDNLIKYVCEPIAIYLS